jgi:DNA-directed RNA polymerase specialized sigma24 family protein
MKKDWVLTQEAFDALLAWLDADRDRAGRKYESIRLRLIKIFNCRGCHQPEELADETINRVVARVVELASGYAGDPALYFYGVSQKVHLEYLRKVHTQPINLAPESSQNTQTIDLTSDISPEYDCLERCLEQLPADNRDLVVRYYQHERKAKIDHRKSLATELGIALNALRIRAHRIRLVLQQCVHDCVEQQPAN